MKVDFTEISIFRPWRVLKGQWPYFRRILDTVQVTYAQRRDLGARGSIGTAFGTAHYHEQFIQVTNTSDQIQDVNARKTKNGLEETFP